MKKIILLAFVLLNAASLYARISPYVSSLLPGGRQALAKAMSQSADAYEQAGNKKRALEYRRAALDVFPIGDDAHALARTLNTNLDDDKTYASFIQSGDSAYKARNYNQALLDYLMALELRQPTELYEKLQLSYLGLGDQQSAAALQSVITTSKIAPQAPADGYGESYYDEGYQAEAEEAYPQEYPLDGYGESYQDELPAE